MDFNEALAAIRKDADVADVHIAGDGGGGRASPSPLSQATNMLRRKPKKKGPWQQRQHPASGQFTSAFELAKVDAPEGLVFGWASVIEEGGETVVDTQGDVIDSVEMEKAAYDFVLNARVAGDMHVRKGIGRLVESIAFTAEKQAALGIDLGKVGHWVGFKIDDAEVLEKVRNGTYAALSIGGRGRRTQIEED